MQNYRAEGQRLYEARRPGRTYDRVAPNDGDGWRTADVCIEGPRQLVAEPVQRTFLVQVLSPNPRQLLVGRNHLAGRLFDFKIR